MARKPCICGKAQAVRPGGLCNRCYGAAGGGNMPKGEVRQVCLCDINKDERTQSRVKIDQATVDRYAEQMNEREFPPPSLFHDGEKYHIGDGWHRVLACDKRGQTQMKAEVRHGGERDALLVSVSSNGDHGLLRNSSDLRKSLRILFADPEWTKWSNREIARHVQCSHGTVNDERSKWDAEQAEAGYAADKKRQYTDSRTGETREMDTTSQQAKRQPKKVDSASTPAKEEDEKPERQSPANPVSLADETSRTESGPAPVLDLVGVPITDRDSLDAFASLLSFGQIVSALSQARRHINDLARLPGAEKYRGQLQCKSTRQDGKDVDRYHCPDLANAIKKMEHFAPYASVCPVCWKKYGETHQRDAQCGVCRGLPYVTDEMWKRTSEEAREAVLVALKPGHGTENA